LGPHPVVTIVGEGGVGKSALAVRCLYDLLDSDKGQKYDAVIWVSLKTKVLTPTGVQEIRDSVITTLGIVQAATEALGAPTQTADLESLLKELQDYLQRLRILLIIDNLETVSTEALRPLLGAVPHGSKILITSRVGLGEIELRYKLDPLDKKQSVALARRYAKSLNLEVLASASDDRLERYCRLLYYNPLLIKWFVSSVSSGADPERLIARGNQAFSSALQFCFENLFNRLSETQREILHILASARRQLTQAELFFLLQETTSLDQTELEAALSALHNSSMLKRTLVEPRRADSGTQVALTDVASEYIARFAPPPPKTFERVQTALKKLREMTEKSVVIEATYKYEIFAVRSSNRDERIAAVYLNRALQELRQNKVTEARKMVERAKSLLPTFPEVYRISALVESRGNDLYKAADEIETAIELDPSAPLARYQFALFLMNEMQDSQQALEQIDAALAIDKDNETLETGRALALTRLGRCREAADIYDRVLANISGRPRKWRITTRDQAAECYRRWAEQDKSMSDRPALYNHLDCALTILEQGLGAKDFDARMLSLYVNIVEDGLHAAMYALDFEQARTILRRMREASFVVDFPPFEMVSSEIFKATFRAEIGSLSAKEMSDSELIKWAPPEDLSASAPSETSEQLRGRVKTITPGSAFGFIVDGSGHDWFFHQNQLVNREDWARLKDGQPVRFREGVNRSGKCAVAVQPVY
jgi:LuxR family glucitol operon transcriptional activator